MKTIYLAIADYGHEGEEVIRAFESPESCAEFIRVLEAYHWPRPGYVWNSNLRERRGQAWRDNHPAGRHHSAEGFTTEECELLP